MSPLPFHPSTPGALLRRASTAGKKLPEMAALLSEHFSPNVLRILGSPEAFRADLFTADCGGAMQVSTLSYNTPVELKVETSADHLLVTTQLRGEETVRSQGRTATGGIGFVVVDSTPAPIVKRFSADSERINLRLDRSALDALWRRTVDASVPPPRVFEPFVGDEAQRQRWWSHQQLLLSYLRVPPDGRQAVLMLRRIEEALMLFLLLEHRHDASHLLCRPAAALDDRRLRRAEAFIASNVHQSLCLADIAAAAGTSIRSLTAAFRARHDRSPMKFVEDLRLDAAHAQLLAGTHGVTHVANEFGFSNLGRFAAAYARRFGAMPSATATSSRDRRRR